jgi:hypothetical protein
MWLKTVTRQPAPEWRRSTFCALNDCFEVTRQNGEVIVRNSARPRRVVRYTIEEWQAFTEGVKAGDFSDLI